MLHTKTSQFEGPLDLLLSLIEQRQLDITKISLAEVTEQFLNYLKKLENQDPTTLADYLSIAAKLLVIKSKAILPSLEIQNDEDDPGVDLESKLVLYKQFKAVAKFLKLLENKNTQSWSRSITFEERISFYPDPNIKTQELYHAITKIISDLKELSNLPKAKIKEAISIQQKITQIQGELEKQIETKLSTLLQNAKNKDEMIVTFLALLELIKQQIFTAHQETMFDEVIIKKRPEPNL